MVSLAGVVGNNSIGYRQNQTKVSRAIKESAGHLLALVFRGERQAVSASIRNRFVDVIVGTPNVIRLNTCLDRIARGIYCHHFDRPFKGSTRVVMAHLIYTQPNAKAFTLFLKHRAEVDLRQAERIGSNPSVFFYRISEPDNIGLRILHMCFYEGVDVFASFIPEGTTLQPNLVNELIQMGVPTCFELEGRKYWLNEADDQQQAGPSASGVPSGPP